MNGEDGSSKVFEKGKRRGTVRQGDMRREGDVKVVSCQERGLWGDERGEKCGEI